MKTYLYHTTTGHKKVYIIDRVELPTGRYLINFHYGRIGQPLLSSTKTPKSVDYYKAVKIERKLTDEKLGKGYFSGAFYTGETPTTTIVRGMTNEQLFDKIEEEGVGLAFNGVAYSAITDTALKSALEAFLATKRCLDDRLYALGYDR